MTRSSSLDYDAAIQFLYERINYEWTPASRSRSRSLDLDRMRALLERLGNPHERLSIVHVAGTKGKGSTATMLSSVLTAAGYRTGLYTSPHLERLEERFVVDGQPATAAELAELTTAVRPAIAALDEDRNRSDAAAEALTFFEATTAMAFFHFLRRAVDVAVIEVGLGGRLDSTNVCRPLLSVITSISYDHTRQLGSDLVSIAYEKAGIIKSGIPVISGVVPSDPARVIEQVAEQRRCRLYQLGREFAYTYHAPPEPRQRSGRGGSCDYREPLDGSRVVREGLSLGLLGEHQAANASLAMAAIERLGEFGREIPEAAIRRGLAEVRCPARIEVLGERPTLILDAAHNVASIEALVRTVRESFPPGPRLLIFAASSDKDRARMLEILLPAFEDVILTQYVRNPRAITPADLALLSEKIVHRETALAGGPRISVCPTPDSAWQTALTRITPEHLVCVTGSFFLAAELRPLVCRRPPLEVPAS